MQKDNTRINEEIRAREVRLIDDKGQNHDAVPIVRALEMAGEAGLDLVEVSPQAVPPVCKIMDYGKYKYQKSKREHEARRSQHIIHLKEVKIRPRTEEHDYQFKLNHIKDFLKAKDKVKVTLMFKGRESTHLHLGEKMLQRIIEDTKEAGTVEQMPKLEGRFMTLVLAPKSEKNSKGEKPCPK